MQHQFILKRRTIRLVVSVIAPAVLLLAAGCVLKIGIGDPKQSKVDPELLGCWLSEEHGQLLTVVAWDESTSLVDWMVYSGTNSDPTPKLRVLNRAWLTQLDDSTFVTLEMLVPQVAREQKHVVLKVEREGDNVVARPLNHEFPPFKQVRTPAELTQAIREHGQSVGAFLEPTAYRKVTKQATKAIRQAFHSEMGG